MRKNLPTKQKERTTKPDTHCVSVGTKLTPISELKTLFTAGRVIFYRVGNDPNTVYYACKLSADEPIFRAECTEDYNFEGNSYNLTKGQYYLKGEWFEMLKGNKNWYVLTKFPKGQGNKCIASQKPVLTLFGRFLRSSNLQTRNYV